MSKKDGHGGQHSTKGEAASTLKTAAEIATERAVAKAEEQVSSDAAVAATGLSLKEIDELRVQAAKAQENWDRLLRTQADLENYRKRVARERQDLVKSANEKLLLDLLVPLDHFEMGLQSAQSRGGETAADPLHKGMSMVLAQFQQFLKAHGITEIQALGQTFDPALHEAVAHQPSDAPEGQIIQQIRKGYRFNDRLLRAAAVVVSSGKPAVPAVSGEPPSRVAPG